MFWVIMAVLGGILGSGSFAMGMAQLYPPFGAAIARRSYNENPDLVAQVSELVEQRYKNVISQEQFVQQMRLAGYDAPIAQQIYDGAQQFLTSYDYVNIWRRGEITEEVLNDRLSVLGYQGASLDHIKAATLYYPNPQDLVRFAVREVYTPAIREQYGLDEDFPSEFLEAARRGGLSDDFARQFWAAHWELPSVRMGYEMFHRKIIDADGLDTLFRTQDIMPFWRDKLLQMSYSRITRVDIRRLYRLGIYDRLQVREAYESLGYNPTDAEALTQFTEVAYSVEDEEISNVPGLARRLDGTFGPSRTMILTSYRSGLSNREEAEQALANLGYPDDATKMLLDQVDFDIQQEFIDLSADAIANRFRDGEIGRIQFQAELTQLGVPARYIDIVMAREIAQAQRRVKLPTKADLDKWFKIDIITPDSYRARMSELGYRDDDIALFLEEALIDRPS